MLSEMASFSLVPAHMTSARVSSLPDLATIPQGVAEAEQFVSATPYLIALSPSILLELVAWALHHSSRSFV